MGRVGWITEKEDGQVAIRLQVPEAKCEVLLLQFEGGVTVTLEKAHDGHVTKGLGGGVKMVGNQEVVLIIAYRAQMLQESITESALGLTDVEEQQI
eukprot:g16307.t1